MPQLSRPVRQMAAIGLLLAALAVVASVTILPVAARIGELREQIEGERIALGRFAALAVLQDKVAEMQRAGRAAGESGAYLKGESDSLRAASLQTFLSELAGANSVRLSSTRALPPRDTDDLRLVGTRVQFIADIEQLREMLYAIESTQPFLFVEALQTRPVSAQAQRDPEYGGLLDTRSFGGDTIGWMIIQTQSPKDNTRVMKEVDSLFANSPFETETQTEQAFAKAFIEQAGDLGFIITAVVGAAFATILLIVGNTMMLTVRERTNEIAVMKTIGFTSERIFALVIGESLLLAVIGGALGVDAETVAALFAPSQVAALAAILAAHGVALATEPVVFAAIGETTGTALRELALRDVVVASAPTPEAMANAVASRYPRRR